MKILDFPKRPGGKTERRSSTHLPELLPANVIRINTRAPSLKAIAPSALAAVRPDPQLIQACAHLHRMAERGAITGVLFALRTPNYKDGVWAAGDMAKPDAMKEAAVGIYRAAFE